MIFVTQWKYWIGLILFCVMNEPLIADSKIVMTRDRDYYNPFATSIKYDLKFVDIDKDSVWDVTYTLMNNRTDEIFQSYTFRAVTFNETGELYFYIRNQPSDYEYRVCLVARDNYKSEVTVGSSQLKGHLLQLLPKMLLELGKKQLLFTIKPCLREWMIVNREGYDNIYFGFYSGTHDVDWSFFIEFSSSKSSSQRKI